MNKKKSLFKEYYLLLLIIFIGFILRFYKFYEFSDFFGDYGRDILIASHIVKYKDFPSYGPYANYPQEIVLQNTPFYYYLLALFYFILRSPEKIAILFGLFGVVLIVLIFYLASLLFDKRTALYAAFFTAISNRFISYSRFVWQPHLIPLLSCLIILFLYLSHKKSPLYLYFAFIVIYISINLHLSSLILLPAYLVWTGYIIYKKFFHHQFFLSLLTFLLAVILLLFKLFSRVYVKNSINISFKSILLNYFPKLLNNITSFSLFNFSPNYRMLHLANIVILFILAHLLINKKINFKQPILILFGILLNIFLFGFFNIKIEEWYFSPFLIPWILSWSLAIARINTHNILKLLLTVFFSLALFKGNETYFKNSPSNEFSSINKTIDAIIEDVNKLKTTKFLVSVGNENILPWADGAFWYVLEEKLNKKLVRLIEGDFKPLVSDPDYFYLVCVSTFYDGSNRNCATSYLLKHNQYYSYDKLIFTEKIDIGQFGSSVFRFLVK